LKKELESERTAKVKAEAKITELESELKETKEELRAANQKGGLADKLDSDLLAAREEREKNASIILGLEAGLKESKSRNSELQKEMEETFKDKVSQLEQETASIRNEKDTILHDLESKLRTSERESNLREDSLRHEVSELRKRWQDAVRRCDGKF
jgi:chromosome segregation ATPase